jgi:Ca-activated chloride channel family protein
MNRRAFLGATGAFGLAALTNAQQPTPPSKLPVQQQPPQRPDEATIITVDVTRVNLLYTVTDRKGRFVTDLTKDDFDVIESKKPQVIQEFTAESDLPLRLGILIDTSNSIRDRFKFEQEAAISFINNVIRTNQDKGLVVSFDTRAELVTDLQGDTEKLIAGVRSLRPGGGTALYDAIFFACRDKLSQDQPRHKFRRAIIIVSDGDDNQSNYTRDQALEMAQKADVVLYAISTNRSKIEQDGDKVLKYYTAETGGRAFFPFQVEDMEQSFENIANELRHQYNLSYKPEPLKTDGLFHTVDLRVKGRKDLVVHVRKGYYAPKM